MELDNPNYYFNRELSWLEFNKRVLEEAQDKQTPLLERLKFLAITASNMDEFFMVRVSSLLDQKLLGINANDPAGMSPQQQLKAISAKAHELVIKQYNCLNRSILPALEKENIHFLKYKDLSKDQKQFVQNYFNTTIYPILTPMAIDQSRPFPLLNNKTLNFIVELSDNEENELFAVIQVPTVIKRIIPLNIREEGKKEFIFIEEIIRKFIDLLFSGYTVNNTSLFRVTRSSDLELDKEETEDLLDEMEKLIKKRRWGNPVRLEIEKGMEKPGRKFLEKTLELKDDEIYEINGYFDLTVWFSVSALEGCDYMCDAPLRPQKSVSFIDRDIFEAIREKDILVHHPYESFDCVVDFVKAAATDPSVLAIKQTLYRVSGNSPIVNTLMQAAENGKQVTVLVELKARFDEENNIIWAKKLEKSGCHVVYGLVGLKTHCKLCLIVRREDDGIRRYVHLGTGNYNDNTAKIYTDLGLFTCKETFGQDISTLFNLLTGYSKNLGFNKISVAPLKLRATFMKHIENEIKNAIEGKEALIIAKMNSLVDITIIKALYKASSYGVKIKLIIRGICCLKSGIPGISENITVVSIIDRFLEHSRIFYFENDKNPKIFLSSADWMPRNLDRRVEVVFPVEDNILKERLIEILEITLSDTEKLRIQQQNGDYERVDKRGKEHLHSQIKFYEMAVAAVAAVKEEQHNDIFKPVLDQRHYSDFIIHK